ncbi:hypothetical protein A6X21_08500 [Planctopirus hydrillae]|uniref:Uncharacterized protein n=1 Tax=Planctopirus hydrillae TaxID=1841610 RepID=A0A1C3E8D5_9PLAN|nr:hypothetical protein A6X21_08500 [Planctopirus hydrillae]
MTAGFEGMGTEMGQDGVWGYIRLGSGGVNGFQQRMREVLSIKRKTLVPLAHRSLEDEQPVPPWII